MFQYPEGLITIGRPIADLILCNARRGLCGPGDPYMHMEKRVNWMRRGTAHRSERLFPSGRVIEIIGNPMPGGGFVMSFTDITAFRKAEQALKEANESLEQRVAERTRELSELNQALTVAKAQTEQASQSKGRFLMAVSHDLMQPMNAARLFSASLMHQANLPPEAQQLVRHLDTSLRSAEDLISDLLDLSRLESGRIIPEWSDFVLTELIEPLRIEFGALASEQGVDLRVHSSRLRVRSDIRLLRRVLQNFMTNAFRYAGNSRMVLGMRRLPDAVRIEVWDQGPGIPRDKLQTIFEEFQRLDNHRTQAERGWASGWPSPMVCVGCWVTSWRYVPGRARAACSASPCRWRATTATRAAPARPACPCSAAPRYCASTTRRPSLPACRACSAAGSAMSPWPATAPGCRRYWSVASYRSWCWPTTIWIMATPAWS